jgi:hypothetical protein
MMNNRINYVPGYFFQKKQKTNISQKTGYFALLSAFKLAGQEQTTYLGKMKYSR